MAGALEGVRVIEFTDELGSYCGKLLADLGADVIKVEPPAGGRQRHTPPYIEFAGEGVDTSLPFWVQNTSKRSVTLDLDTAGGREQARELAVGADVVLDDNPPGYLEERGLGAESLLEERPGLVYTSLTGFGRTGLHASFAYTDIIGQAMSGVLNLSGEPADPPQQICGEQSNVSASIQAAQGTLFALLHAEATGEGQIVEVSAQEAMSMSQETAMQTWDMQHRNRVRTGSRGMLPVELPGAGVYECADGHVFCYILAPAGVDFPALVDWMREEGKQQDLDEEPYAELCNGMNMAFLTQVLGDPTSAAEKFGQLGHIQEVVKDFFREKSARDAFEEGQRRRILNGIVSSPQDIGENPQLRAREWFTQIEADFLGKSIEWPGGPYRLSETPVQITRPPRLGEHTDEILGALAQGRR